MTEQTPYFADDQTTLWLGDSLEVLRGLADGSVDCCVTSPPYFGLRDYGEAGQYGLEASPAEYVETLRRLFAEVRRVLAADGTLWLNLGDSYVSKPPGNVRGVSDATGLHGGRTSDAYRDNLAAGHGTKADTTKFGLPEKNLIGVPWRSAFALQDDGWILRSDIIWAKSNGMPESVVDRVRTQHEHVFMFAKSKRYWFDLDPIREPVVYPPGASALNWARDSKEADVPGQTMRQHRTSRTHGKAAAQHERGKNPGDVWTLPTQPFSAAHFAVMPLALAERAIQAGCKPGGTVLDPFSGSGTTGLAAHRHGRKYVGIDLSRDYLDLSLKTRFSQPGLDFADVAIPPGLYDAWGDRMSDQPCCPRCGLPESALIHRHGPRSANTHPYADQQPDNGADLILNVRAVLRLLTPDHLTPLGKRQIENVLDAHMSTPTPEEASDV